LHTVDSSAGQVVESMFDVDQTADVVTEDDGKVNFLNTAACTYGQMVFCQGTCVAQNCESSDVIWPSSPTGVYTPQRQRVARARVHELNDDDDTSEESDGHKKPRAN
jgi:hypothetical protein